MYTPQRYCKTQHQLKKYDANNQIMYETSEVHSTILFFRGCEKCNNKQLTNTSQSHSGATSWVESYPRQEITLSKSYQAMPGLCIASISQIKIHIALPKLDKYSRVQKSLIKQLIESFTHYYL